MENPVTWLLVCNASKARLYAMHKVRVFREPNAKNLHLVNEFAHEESRMKNVELKSDRDGEFGSGTFVEATSAKQHEAEQFALELIHTLEAGRKDGHYRDLIIIAPPAFMGLLNKHMHNEMNKLVNKKIEKDYTQKNPNDLMENLVNHL